MPAIRVLQKSSCGDSSAGLDLPVVGFARIPLEGDGNSGEFHYGGAEGTLASSTTEVRRELWRVPLRGCGGNSGEFHYGGEGGNSGEFHYGGEKCRLGVTLERCDRV